jgi:hypothetical protein
MTLNMLLEAGFEFEGLRKISAINKNLPVAKNWLRPKETKEKIDKIKTGETEEMNKNDLDNYLTSVYILRKIAGNRSFSAKTREEASNALNNVGIDLTSLKDSDKEVLKKGRETFEKRYNDSNPPIGEPEEPSEPETTEKESEAPAEEPAKEPEKPSEPDETPFEDDLLDRTKVIRSPKKASREIQKMMDSTLPKIKDAIEKVKKSKDMASKLNARKLETLLSKYRRKMNSLQGRAEAGPKNARQAHNAARTETELTLSKLTTIPLKGAVRRGIQGSKEAIQRAAERGKEAYERAKSAVEKSETLRRIGQTSKKAMERVKSATEKGLERVGQKIEQSAINKNYNLIKKYLGADSAEQYQKSPQSNSDLVTKAKQKEKEAVNAMKEKAAKVKKKTPPSALSNLRSRLAQTIGRSPSNKEKEQRAV